MYDDVTYVDDDVTYVDDDVTYVDDDVTYVYDDMTYVGDDVTYVCGAGTILISVVVECAVVIATMFVMDVPGTCLK